MHHMMVMQTLHVHAAAGRTVPTCACTQARGGAAALQRWCAAPQRRRRPVGGHWRAVVRQRPGRWSWPSEHPASLLQFPSHLLLAFNLSEWIAFPAAPIHEHAQDFMWHCPLGAVDAAIDTVHAAGALKAYATSLELHRQAQGQRAAAAARRAKRAQDQSAALDNGHAHAPDVVDTVEGVPARLLNNAAVLHMRAGHTAEALALLAEAMQVSNVHCASPSCAALTGRALLAACPAHLSVFCFCALYHPSSWYILWLAHAMPGMLLGTSACARCAAACA